MMHLIQAAIVVLLLAGCANMAARQANRDINNIAASCDKTIQSSPALAPLRGKIRLVDADPLNLVMLNDRHKADPDEQAAILAYDSIKTACAVDLIKIIRLHSPAEYSSLAQEAAIQSQQRRAAIYSGTMTFGQFNKLTQDAQLETSRRLAKLDAEYRNIALRQQTANAASLSATAPTIQAMQPAQLAQPFVLRPLNTSCIQSANQTNCTTK
ncbi:MAG: hypothetical protein ACLQHK_08355 [Gallionellaceae bacterium]